MKKRVLGYHYECHMSEQLDATTMHSIRSPFNYIQTSSKLKFQKYELDLPTTT